jgi:hypothetical protein
MSDLQILIDAAAEYAEMGFKVIPNNGKEPIGGNWPNTKFTISEIAERIREADVPAIGVQLGPKSRVIDIEADSLEEEAIFNALFAGDVPITATFSSTRGKHWFFAWDTRLEKTEQAVVSITGRNGGKLGVRIGAGDRGAQSIVPPSAGREWLVSLNECAPAKLPDAVIEKIVAAAKSSVSAGREQFKSSDRISSAAALAAMLRHKPDADEQDSSKRLLAVCCRAVEFNLSDDGTLATIRQYEKKNHFARDWSDDEVITRLRDAEKLAERGSAVTISNFSTKEIENDDGEKQTIVVPASMTEIIDTINELMGDWPRRVDNMLFVDDHKHGLDYFDRRTTAALFGWLRRHYKVSWGKGGSLVSQAELFAEIERTTQRYEAIELLPHEPPISGIYYRGKSPEPGDGSHLRYVLDRFRPETTIDRDLILAAFMTAFWGGLPGCRPVFVVTSDDGRGVGKSKVPETVGYLCNGYIDVSANEDIEQLKTRMLTPAARTKRIALMDNVKTLRLSWAELESMITSPTISGRQLYVGEGQRPNLLTWFITLNGVSMATDMAQRSVIIKVVKGENSGPWWEQTRQYIDQYREQIIGDIIGALRGQIYPLESFTRWATWEQHILQRLPEPAEAQRVILERQGEANCELEEIEIIEQHFAEQLERLQYDPATDQVRIPVAVAARWYGWAVGEPTKTAAASKRLHQMAAEGQAKRISPDSSRQYGRGFVWTGANADVVGETIKNDLSVRLAAIHQT